MNEKTGSLASLGSQSIEKTFQGLDKVVEESTAVAATAKLAARETMSDSISEQEAKAQETLGASNGVIDDAMSELTKEVHDEATEKHSQDQRKKSREEIVVEQIAKVRSQQQKKAQHQKEELATNIHDLRQTLSAVNAEERVQKRHVLIPKMKNQAREEATRATNSAKAQADKAIRQAKRELREEKLQARKATFGIKSQAEEAEDDLDRQIKQQQIVVDKAKRDVAKAHNAAEDVATMGETI